MQTTRTGSLIIFIALAITIPLIILKVKEGRERNERIINIPDTNDSFFDVSGWSEESVSELPLLSHSVRNYPLIVALFNCPII
jgi:hypothetical protein